MDFSPLFRNFFRSEISPIVTHNNIKLKFNEKTVVILKMHEAKIFFLIPKFSFGKMSRQEKILKSKCQKGSP